MVFFLIPGGEFRSNPMQTRPEREPNARRAHRGIQEMTGQASGGMRDGRTPTLRRKAKPLSQDRSRHATLLLTKSYAC